MRRALAVLLFLPALVTAQDEPAGRLWVVRAGRVHTGSGEVIEHGLIVLRNGKIVDVRPAGEFPKGATLIEADQEVVIPGLIDAQSSVSEPFRNAPETVAPDVRAIDGYDFYASSWRQLSSGVTSAYLSPGSRRLVSGQGAVVKTGGPKPQSRILADRLGLHVTLGEEPKNPPTLYTPPVPPSADHPILPARRQYPSSRMGEFAVLRRTPLGEGPLFIQTHTEDDLVKAAMFAQEAGRGLVLVGAGEAPRVADFLAARKIPVIFDAGFAPGRRSLADRARPALEAPGTIAGAVALARAGVRFALVPPDDTPNRDLLFIAAAAVRAGLSEKEALAAITRVPAEILGVQNRVGSIARGRDADLVFLTADPFSPGALVRRVMIDGAFVFERKEADVQTYRAVRDSSGKPGDTIALRGGRILTVTQGVLADGLLLLQGGKISYVGRGRPVPAGARQIDATGLTVVPGFIDFGSHLGFHVDRTDLGLRRSRSTGVPSASTVPPSQLIRPDDPAFREVAASGITSIVLSPETSGVCSLLKLAGGSAVVTREVAALKFVAKGGTGGYQALKEQLAQGRKYFDDWEAFERSRRDAPPARDPVSGTWRGTFEEAEAGPKTEFIAELKLDGVRVTGTLQAPASGGHPEAVEGTFDQGELKLEQARPSKVDFVLRAQGTDHLKGIWTSAGHKGTLECRRDPAPAIAKVEVKEPRRDEALEPYRKLFTREIPAIVSARDLPAIESAARAFRGDYGLELVLEGAEDASLSGDVAIAQGASVALGPEFLVDRRGAWVNTAEALASQGVSVSFASGASTATAELPLQAAYAVRTGLEPFDALKALTVNPARMLRLEQRLGSIERGRDADLVLFTGDPFAPSSRVKMVLVDGKIVYEAP